MNNNHLLRKGLVVGIIFLFLGIAVQPITSTEQNIDAKQVGENKPMNDADAKEYLFETIIQIANNPKVKDLFNRYKGDLFTSDYDYKIVFRQLLVKNPRLLCSIMFTRPTMTYEYLDRSYDRGIKFVNIIGEEKTLEMIRSVSVSNQDFFNDFNDVIKNDERLSARVSTLEMMNCDPKSDSPLKFHPIICGILYITLGPIFIALEHYLGLLYDFPLLFKIFLVPYIVIELMAFIFGCITPY